ncbi:hypothetical protein NF27_HL00090 [Candidatus Jidaibacter acanthamoeba]|uniref:WGR domain-containing protein n=1 Tax=Candidatus Jidaibacter acanthamoebae TaxID=86105 RepID=A0A0C1QG66_9RICK|nr:WGR domain-containing protein [Candidatus Jidaibacter acanthamoeba]KIE04544.1 hypothetical protein NF27_HL00090 [Candidatus Jidaibacter acanthamoeba]
MQKVCQIWKWRSESRYYTISLQQNLFNEWTIIKSWGGLQNNLGSFAVQTFDHLNNALKEIANVTKKIPN